MKTLNLLQPTIFRFDEAGSSAVRAIVESAVEASRESTRNTPEVETTLLRPVGSQPIDPMLLVYQERLQTFRLLARWIGDIFRPLLAMRMTGKSRTPARRSLGVASRVDSGAM